MYVVGCFVLINVMWLFDIHDKKIPNSLKDLGVIF